MNINFRKFFSNKKIWVGLVLGVVLLLGFLEIGLQIKQGKGKSEAKKPEMESQQQKIVNETKKIPYVYQPNVTWRAKPWLKSSFFSTNSQGFRGDKEFKKEKDKETYRIIILGGSAAWGYGASANDKTIGVFLENELKNENFNKKNVEVLNFAEVGYNSFQEAALWSEIVDYKPDLVVQYTGFNDINNGFVGIKPGWNIPFHRESLMSYSDWGIITYLIKDKLSKLTNEVLMRSSRIAEKSAIYRSIKFRLNKHAYDGPKEMRHSDIGEITNVFKNNVYLGQQAGKGKNIPVIVVLQPSIFTSKKALSPAEKNILDDYEKNFPGATKYFNDGLSKIKADLKENKIEFVDGSDFFENEKGTIYFDIVHYFDAGNKVIAERLAKLVISQKNF